MIKAMVRFSEIIRMNQNKKDKERIPVAEKNVGQEKLRLSDMQIAETGKREDVSRPPLVESDNKKIKAFYNDLLERAMDIQSKVKHNKDLTPSRILQILHRIIKDDFISRLYDYAIPISKNYGLQSQSISVTLASLKIGKGLGYDTKKLLQLGLAAFFENVGMYKIPDATLTKRGKLSSNELTAIKKHPEIGAQILGRMSTTFKWLTNTTLQIHERLDGSGYPKGLKGEDISEIASIIGLVDTYMAMTKNRPYRDKQMEPDAVKSIVGLSKSKFPARVVKAFLNQISIFPVNSYVKLNNESIGRVVSTSKSQPLRPVIELVYDGRGQKLEKRQIVNLVDSSLLHITSFIDERP